MDLNEVIITGTLQEIEVKSYGDNKSFTKLLIASESGYEGKEVEVAVEVWGKAQDRITANEGDRVAIKGSASGRRSDKGYLNMSISAYSVIDLGGMNAAPLPYQTDDGDPF